MKKLTIAMCLVMILAMMFMTLTTFATTQENITEEVSQSSNASEVTLKNLSEKEEKIAYYTEKYGDKTEGTVAYYISLVRKYSVPVCFLLLIWGAFNQFVVGNKKLQQREKGFKMIIAAMFGLIVFQSIPFIYALFVAGR